jgi:hypothetical protein
MKDLLTDASENKNLILKSKLMVSFRFPTNERWEDIPLEHSCRRDREPYRAYVGFLLSFIRPSTNHILNSIHDRIDYCWLSRSR